MMLKKIKDKIKSFLKACQIALKTNSYGELANFLIYRSSFGRLWARFNGYFFHQSTVIWFQDSGKVHSRITLLLNRLKREFPQLQTVNLDLEFYADNGTLISQWQQKQIPCTRPFVLDSKELPSQFSIPKPFNGTLFVKLWLNLPDRDVVNRKGLFASARSFIDYYEEGNFITTLHDYCQYVPDQGINYCCSGMIPAYCNPDAETFILIHATKPGIKTGELEAILYNNQGGEKRVTLSSFQPFQMRQIMISELFPDAHEFLGSDLGQIEVEGNFPQVMKRIAYGVRDKHSNAFSFDHAIYTIEPKIGGSGVILNFAQRKKMPKGWFNPFFVIENEFVTTSALLFHHKKEPMPKHVDILIYDDTGKLIVNAPSYALLNQTKVIRIGVRELLAKHGISSPFMGHGEAIYHQDSAYKRYSTTLELCVEYVSSGRFNSVIYGSEPWNGPRAFANKHHLSGSRVVCNEAQTTYMAISNCSYDYDYDLTACFTLNLLVGGEIKRRKSFTLAPNATFFKAVDEIFPDACELFLDYQGIGYLVTSDLNCSYLTHAFLDQDRKSKVFSVEHSLAGILPETLVASAVTS